MEREPLGLAYSGDGVNTAIFRVGAIETAGEHQFVTYYAPDGRVVVGHRKAGQAQWDLAVQNFYGRVSDAHNVVVLGVSSDGIVHLAYDHHGDALNYRVSGKPFDNRSFGERRAMTGRHEDHVTYPQFMRSPEGTLYFFYRDGKSGNGSLCLNRYDVATQSWKALQHPLIDGEDKCNPYSWRPAMGADGSIHIAWCWRDTPDAGTNHDLCYAKSNDGGHTWFRSDGSPQPLPITQENAEVVLAIPKGSNLINQCSAAADGTGHPHLAEYMNDETGTPQYFDVWFDGAKWRKSQVSHRTSKFSLSGGGSLAIPISRPEIAMGRSGTVSLITRDVDLGGGIRFYQATAPYEQWKAVDITDENLGNWEPSYDLTALRDTGVLNLFVLHVQQGNHERTTDLPPQEAAILRIPLP